MLSGEEGLVISTLFEEISVVRSSACMMLGSVGEFHLSRETWPSYVERFDLFCDCLQSRKGQPRVYY